MADAYSARYSPSARCTYEPNPPPEFNAFIQTRVASGAYASEREVLQKAFDLLEKRESLLAHIDEGRGQLELGRFV
jgi:Arc/MetJ-type ribon-helix-helix transcriptional regulator